MFYVIKKNKDGEYKINAKTSHGACPPGSLIVEAKDYDHPKLNVSITGEGILRKKVFEIVEDTEAKSAAEKEASDSKKQVTDVLASIDSATKVEDLKDALKKIVSEVL